MNELSRILIMRVFFCNKTSDAKPVSYTTVLKAWMSVFLCFSPTHIHPFFRSYLAFITFHNVIFLLIILTHHRQQQMQREQPNPGYDSKLTEMDFELIEEAKRVSRRLHKPHYHVVIGALRTSLPSDKVYTGIHIESSQALCGEVSAVCSMINDGRAMSELETIVALAGDDNDKNKFRLFSPCGRCRELIGDCNGKARVIVGTMEQPYVMTISQLMPLKCTDVENEYWTKQKESL